MVLTDAYMHFFLYFAPYTAALTSTVYANLYTLLPFCKARLSIMHTQRMALRGCSSCLRTRVLSRCGAGA
jgi:hypothetical protein